MPNHKNIVVIDKDKKRMNRIFDDLKVHRECIIDSDDEKWHGTMRNFGKIVQKNNLIKHEFIDPVLNYKDQNVIQKRLIRLKPDTEILKIEGNKKNFFHFRRRTIL